MSTPTKNSQGFGALLMGATKMTLRAALNNVVANTQIIDYVASKMYVEETNGDWSKVSVAERALWQQRVRSVVFGLVDTIAV